MKDECLLLIFTAEWLIFLAGIFGNQPENCMLKSELLLGNGSTGGMRSHCTLEDKKYKP